MTAPPHPAPPVAPPTFAPPQVSEQAIEQAVEAGLARSEEENWRLVARCLTPTRSTLEQMMQGGGLAGLDPARTAFSR
ncbi:MAG TPA: hypothetical protein VGD07_07850 [Methylomirabilota bacterium]